MHEPRAAVIGAGPVGLTLAGRLAQRGVPTTLFEARPRHEAEGSRALCMHRETLEIWARLGVGGRVAARGVQWRTGRTYFRDRLAFDARLGERLRPLDWPAPVRLLIVGEASDDGGIDDPEGAAQGALRARPTARLAHSPGRPPGGQRLRRRRGRAPRGCAPSHR